MYHHILKRLPLFVAVVLLLLPARPQNSNSRDLAKLDLLLRQAVAEGSDDTRRVIVRVDADSRAGARERLEHRGAYHRYEFTISGFKLNDYPKFGVWPDGYYMSANQFQCNIIYCVWGGPGGGVVRAGPDAERRARANGVV